MVTTSQTVTVLFTDIVKSTELFSELPPEQADRVRQEHFTVLRQAVAAAGGTEVKNLGDGIMVVFTSLTRALSCAVGMQQGVHRQGRRGGAPLAIRVGVSMGEATEEDGDYFGDPVVEAARLCARAEGGQILTTELVRVMAGRHAAQEIVGLGPVELKGLPGQVAVAEVQWAPAGEGEGEGTRPALPGRLVGTSAETLFAFFGRAGELELLKGLHKQAGEGRLQVALVSGEPGIGKTSLVAQLCRELHGDGAAVLYGGCEEDLAVPFRPWIGALGPLAESLPGAVLESYAGNSGLSIARLLPGLARRLDSPLPTVASDADAERLMIMEGVVRLLAAAAETHPLVIVLDDLHWADAASLQLLHHLVLSAHPMRVLVLGTFRDSDLDRRHPLTPLLADLRREPSVHRLHLHGLEDVEILGLLEAAAGHDMTEEGVGLAHALRRETGGNPFFVVEVLRHLGENGIIVLGDDSLWTLSQDLAELGLPSSVREVVSRRVARLGDEVERTLLTASVIGRDFDLAVLSPLTGVAELDLVDVMESAIGAGLLSEVTEQPGRYRFVHALIQHTLYQEMSATRRQLAHQKVAETLEELGDGDPDQLAALARHWMAATRPAEVGKALHYAQRAGHAALAAWAPADAAEWFSQALDLLERQTAPDQIEHCRLLVDLGTAQHRAGLPGHRGTLRQAAEMARALGDVDLMVAAALAGRRGDVRTAEAEPERIAILEDALGMVGREHPEKRALLLTSLAEVTDARDWERRRDLGDEAVDLIRPFPDAPMGLDVLISAYYAHAQPERLAQRLTETERVVRAADRLGDPVLAFRARWARLHSCVEAAELGEIDRRLAEMRSLADRTGLAFHAWELLMVELWRALLRGDVTGAEATNDQALELGLRLEEPEAMAAYGGALFDIRRYQGRLEELVEPFAAAVVDNPAIPVFRLALACAYCEVGRGEEAAKLLEQDVATGFGAMPRDTTWTTAMALALDCAATLGDAETAASLYERARPFSGIVAFVQISVNGPLARPLGRAAHQLDRPEEADTLFEEALAITGRLEAPYWSSRTRLDRAEALLEQGRRDEAAEDIQRAAGTAQKFGLAGLERRAAGLAGTSR